MTITRPTRRASAKRAGQLFNPVRYMAYLTAEHVRILNQFAAERRISASEALRQNIALMVPGEYTVRPRSNDSTWVAECRTLQEAIEKCDALNREARMTNAYEVWSRSDRLYPHHDAALDRRKKEIAKEAFGEGEK